MQSTCIVKIRPKYPTNETENKTIELLVRGNQLIKHSWHHGAESIVLSLVKELELLCAITGSGPRGMIAEVQGGAGDAVTAKQAYKWLYSLPLHKKRTRIFLISYCGCNMGDCIRVTDVRECGTAETVGDALYIASGGSSQKDGVEFYDFPDCVTFKFEEWTHPIDINGYCYERKNKTRLQPPKTIHKDEICVIVSF